MAIPAKTNAISTAKRRRGRIQLSMMVCSPVVVRSNEQVVDATVEVWSLNVGGTVGGSVRGYAADVPETSGVAVFVEPGAARRTASEVVTGNMVELVDSEPAGAAGPPA